MVEIINKTHYRLPRPEIKITLARTLKYLSIKSADVSVVFVSPNQIKKLNAQYRKKNQPTDVLSFAYQSDKNNLDGEIIICYSIAQRNAKEFKHSTASEIKKLLVHSLLHLVGYNHKASKSAKQMEKLETEILDYII